MIKEKEDVILKNRLAELSETAYYRGVITYTDFLNLSEQTVLFESLKDFKAGKFSEWGGYDMAERKMFCFLPDECYDEIRFPMCTLKIEAVHTKFSEKLNHRDYLGAILNLGISRGKVGDILVDFPIAYVFCQEKIADYIADNLIKVKHTLVTASFQESGDMNIQPEYEEIKGSVASLRLDAMLPVVLKGSRSRLAGLISGEKVFVNGRMISSNSYVVKEKDVVSVRGFGKFIFKEIVAETKKGRFYILIYKYI